MNANVKINTLSNIALENKLKELISSERKLLHLILLHIREVDKRKIYLERACSSLFEYLTKKLGYSSSAAQRRIEASRLLREVPVLAEKIEKGTLNLTQVGEFAKAIKQKERESSEKITSAVKSDLLQKIENKSSFETQKLLAQELDLNLKQPEQNQIQKDESVHLQITLTKTQYEKLLKCKDMNAHKLLQNNQGTGLAEVIEVLSDKFLNENKRSTSAPAVNRIGNIANESNKTLSLKTKKIILSQQMCCQYKDAKTGEICKSTFALEIDHKTSRWAGGNHHIDNLQVLCSQHNKYKYQKESGVRF
ncbi:MAG: HNH endonuclease signature motif containing protein [Bdellovibrionota bacterium]